MIVSCCGCWLFIVRVFIVGWWCMLFILIRDLTLSTILIYSQVLVLPLYWWHHETMYAHQLLFFLWNIDFIHPYEFIDMILSCSDLQHKHWCLPSCGVEIQSWATVYTSCVRWVYLGDIELYLEMHLWWKTKVLCEAQYILYVKEREAEIEVEGKKWRWECSRWQTHYIQSAKLNNTSIPTWDRKPIISHLCDVKRQTETRQKHLNWNIATGEKEYIHCYINIGRPLGARWQPTKLAWEIHSTSVCYIVAKTNTN